MYHCSNFVARTKMERRQLHSNRATGRHLKGARAIMKRRLALLAFLALGFWASRPTLRTSRRPALHGRSSALRPESATGSDRTHEPRPAGAGQVFPSNGCTVVSNLDGNAGQVFLVRPAQGLLPQLLADVLQLVNGILDAEPDQTLVIPPNANNQATASTAPRVCGIALRLTTTELLSRTVCE